MLACTLFGCSPGFKFHSFNPNSTNWGDAEKAWVNHEPLILLPGDHMRVPRGSEFVLSLARRGNLTWVGRYHHLEAAWAERGGYYYGVGLWFNGTSVSGGRLLEALGSLCDTLHGLIPNNPRPDWQFTAVADPMRQQLMGLLLSEIPSPKASTFSSLRPAVFLDCQSGGLSSAQLIDSLQADSKLAAYDRVYLAASPRVQALAGAPVLSSLLPADSPKEQDAPPLPPVSEPPSQEEKLAYLTQRVDQLASWQQTIEGQLTSVKELLYDVQRKLETSSAHPVRALSERHTVPINNSHIPPPVNDDADVEKLGSEDPHRTGGAAEGANETSARNSSVDFLLRYRLKGGQWSIGTVAGFAVCIILLFLSAFLAWDGFASLAGFKSSTKEPLEVSKAQQAPAAALGKPTAGNFVPPVPTVQTPEVVPAVQATAPRPEDSEKQPVAGVSASVDTLAKATAGIKLPKAPPLEADKRIVARARLAVRALSTHVKNLRDPIHFKTVDDVANLTGNSNNPAVMDLISTINAASQAMLALPKGTIVTPDDMLKLGKIQADLDHADIVLTDYLK